VVLRYRSYLESRQLAPGTVNLRLGAVRRLAYEAADCGLLSSDLAAGIRRVKGVKKLGVRLGNWLTVEQAHSLWQAPDNQGLKGKRDRALLALLLACGLRRHEAVGLRIDDLQQREEHWAIVDLVGKAGHVRKVPIPDCVKGQLDEWLRAAGIARGRIFRRVTRMGRIWGDVSPNFMWFKASRESFVYIDRIVVSISARDKGIARVLYEDLLAAAKRAGHSRVVCEVNIKPPNPVSEAFHVGMGFEEVGQATIHNGTKTVRYFEKTLR